MQLPGRISEQRQRSAARPNTAVLCSCARAPSVWRRSSDNARVSLPEAGDCHPRAAAPPVPAVGTVLHLLLQISQARTLTILPLQVRAPFLWQGKGDPVHAALAAVPEQAQKGSAPTPAAAAGGRSRSQPGIGGGTLLLRRQPAAQGLPQQRGRGGRAGLSEDLCQDHLQRRHLGRGGPARILAAPCSGLSAKLSYVS